MATTLTFTDEQMALLNRAIVELPFKDAAPLVDSMNKQIVEARERQAAELEAQRNRNRDEGTALPPTG